MPYFPRPAQASLDTEGLRKFSEEEYREIARAWTELERTVGVNTTAIAALDTRIDALEAWKTLLDTLPVMRVGMNTQQVIAASTYTKLLLDTVVFDTVAGWDAANKRYRPNRAGYYRFSWTVFSSNSVTLTRTLTAFYKNGAGYDFGADMSGTTGMSVGSSLITLNGSTDYVELMGWIAAATPTVGSTGTPSLCQLSGEWVRPL